MIDMPLNITKQNHIYLIYMYKEDLALNNLQWFICHKTKPNPTILFNQKSDFHMIDNLSIEVHALRMRPLIAFSR